MPVAHQPVQVSLSDVLQVRAGALEEDDLWSVLCQSAEAVQDIFMREVAVSDGLPSFVISPYTLLLCPSGRVKFAESVDTSLPDIRSYLPPEVLSRQPNPSHAAVEKLYVYSLGTTIFWAAQYGQPGRSLGHSLNAILMAMCDQNATSRVPLMTVLEACNHHAQRSHTGLPYSHNLIRLSKTVLGSVYELDKLFNSGVSGLDTSHESYDASRTSSLPHRPHSNGPSEHSHNSGRISPGKRQLRNGHDSFSQKRPRSNRSRHSEHYADADSRSRSRSGNRNSSNSTHRNSQQISSSDIESQESYENACRRDHSSHRQANGTAPVEETDARSYHMSDIFSPAGVSHKTSVHPSMDNASQRSCSPHVRDSSGRPPVGPSSRRSRSPPSENSRRRSRASQVYERLRERRERLSLLREQMGFLNREPLRSRSVPNFFSDSENFSDDGSDYVRNRSLEDRYRSARSLNSASSAQEGSYYPDQFSRYGSAGTLPQDDDDDAEYHGNERPDLQPNPPIVFPGDIVPSRQQAVSRQPGRLQNGAMPNNKKPKKLKKFFGPEFVVMSSEPNDTIDVQPSFLCKAGKIPTDRKQITVVLLNGRRLDLMCDLGTLGNEMYDMVVSHIGVQDKYFFGLAYIKDGEYLFLDPDEKLYKVGPESWKEEVKKGSKKVNSRDKFTLFFRVKFYVENTTILRDPTSRHQYYLQLRKDILEERTTCDEQAALQLASLALQAEMGDYVPDSMGQNYFLPEHYVPTAIIDVLGISGVRQRAPPMHEMHQGMEERQAEMEFLLEARKLPEYGIHFHRVTKAKKDVRTSIWYGICTRGLILYEKRGSTRVQVHAHPWHLTRKIAFNRKKFSIEPNDGSHHKILHYTDNYKKGRYLLKMCQNQHTFQMAMRSRAIASQQFIGDFTSSPQHVNNTQAYYNSRDDVDADFSDAEESFPDTPRSGAYHDDGVSQSYSQRSTNIGSYKTPYEEVRPNIAVRPKMPEPLYSEPPAFDDSRASRIGQPQPREPAAFDDVSDGLRPHRSRQDIPSASRMSQPQSRAQSMNRGPRTQSMDRGLIEAEVGYATIGDVRRARSEERSNTPAERSESLPPTNGYHGIQDDRHVPEPGDGGSEMIDPYVIDASIRTHERTHAPFAAEDHNLISETLRDRLQDLPSPEQPEREISIITLRKDRELGLGFTIVGGENSSSMDLGIFVKSIAPNGPAEQDGRIQPGDRIISINGQSLEGVSHNVAVDILRSADGAVQLIVSQPKSTSPVPRIDHEFVDDVMYAKVNKPLHSKPNLSASDQSLNMKPPTASVHRRKSTPPKKPLRRPESFGGSNYSLDKEGLRTPTHVARVAANKSNLSIQSASMSEQDNGNQQEQKQNGRQNGFQNGRQNGLQNGRPGSPQQHSRDLSPVSGHEERRSYVSSPQIMISGNEDDDERDFRSATESDVPTPESSDIDDLFPDEDNRNTNTRINLYQAALRSPVSEMERPPSAYESQQETGRESVMSGKSATDTDRGSAVPMDMRGTQDFKPGDRFHVHLSKRSGSLGISVTGGVNTSVKHGGIYIKSMVPSGAAAKDGRIQIGDRVLEVNSEALNGVTHKQAVEALRRAPEHSTLIIERGLPPSLSNMLPPTPAASPLVGIDENGEPVLFSSTQEMTQSEPPTTTTSSDVVTSPERTTSSTTRNADQSRPNTSTGPSSELPPTTSPTSHESTSSTPIPTSNVASPTIASNITSPVTIASSTTSNAPSPRTSSSMSNVSSPVTASYVPSLMAAPEFQSPETVSNSPSSALNTRSQSSASNMPSPGTTESPRTVISPSITSSVSPTEQAAMEREIIQESPFSELSLPLSYKPSSVASSGLSARQPDGRRMSEVSLPIPSDINFSDSDNDMLPSEASYHSRAPTPTIEAFQEDYEDDDTTVSPPQSYGESPPQSEDESEDYDSEVQSESPEPSDSEDDDEDEDSEINDMFDPGFTSPALSTREADTLTPTAHLFGTGTPTRGVYGMRTTPSRSLLEGRPSPLPESAAESWLDSPPHSPPPPPPPYSPPDSPPPSPSEPPPVSNPITVPSPSIVPSDATTVHSSPVPRPQSHSSINTSGDQRETPFSVQSPSNQSFQSPDYSDQRETPLSERSPSNRSLQSPDYTDQDRITSPGTDIASPSFGSDDEESLPGFGSTLDSMGALTLSQTVFSTMGLDSEIELPDLSYVNPENTFEVLLEKGPQGLGFSIQGGRGLHKDPMQCLIRIKKIFPGSPAAQSEMLDEGDIVLAVNDNPVHHLSHDETVGVLRGATNEVRLLLCRPSDEELEQMALKQEEKVLLRRQRTKDGTTSTSPTPVSPPNKELNTTQPFTPPITNKELNTTRPFTPPFTPEVIHPPKQKVEEELSWPPSSPEVSTTEEAPMTQRAVVGVESQRVVTPSPSDEHDGEYIDITLIKPARGGFGFTVAGGANSGGVYIKDIMHDPALSDGRLKKGDKVLKVNDTDLIGMSHYDAVSFLRTAPQEVTLRICRNKHRPDMASPSPPHSPVKHLTDSAPSTRSNTPSASSQDLPIVKIKRNQAGHLGMSLTLDLKSRRKGIFVGGITPGLPMDIEGSIQTGDLVHTINGRSLDNVGLLEARRVLDQAIPLVKIQASRDGWPVHPVKQPSQTSSVTSSPRPQTPHSATGPPMPSSSPPVEDKPVKPDRVRAAVKPSVMNELDFDLGDVSEDESWEDFSSDPEENSNSMEDVEAILASLGAGNGKPNDKEQMPAISKTEAPKEESSSTPSSKPVIDETSSGYPPTTTSSSSAQHTPSKTSGDDDFEGTSHYSTPTGTSSDEDLPKTSTAVRGTAPPLTPISENESFAFTPYKSAKENITELASPVSPDSIASPIGGMGDESDRESPTFGDSPIDDLLRTPRMQELTETPQASPTPDRFDTPVGRKSTPLDFGSTPTNVRSTPTSRFLSVESNRSTPANDHTEPTTSEGGVMWIDLEKPANGSLGFSLTGGMKGGKTTLLVKTIMPDGIADNDGRLKIGDKILQVNGQSFVGMTQNKAVGVLRKCKGKVTIAIARNMSRPASQASELHRTLDNSHMQSYSESARNMRDIPVPAPRLGLQSATSPPANDLSVVSEGTASLELELDFGEKTEDFASDNDDETEHDEDESDSINFESSVSLPMSPHSVVITPPFQFSEAINTKGQDTDSDLDDTMDLPKDSPMTLPDKKSLALQLSKKMGQRAEESDESSSWGSDTDIPLSMNDRGTDPTPRGTPSNKILSVISDAELKRMTILRPATGGRYTGKTLRSVIGSIQKQIDKQDPAEEYKVLRQDLTNGTCDEANKPINKDKNRYRNVLPYDKTRVVIEKGVTSDYINASHIQVQVGKDTQHYIACQGPLPNTTTDFWQMVWEQRADVIAMVTLAVESGKVKCHRYWPDSMETPIMVGDRFQLRLDNLQTLEHFDIRKISMTDTQTNSIHYVTHLNFTTWPDHGVPASALPLLRYTRYMRRIHTNGPIVVHCSAGIGRTGTLITIDTVIGLIDRGEQFKIVEIVKDLRSQRQGMIQTKDQYAFCYKASMDALKTLL